MSNPTKNERSSIGSMIGRLIQQYELRIKYASYKHDLMEHERLKASALGQSQKEATAKVSRDVWAVYAKNLASKRNEMIQDIKSALVCYNATERRVWWLHFIERKSAYEIEEIVGINSRTAQRMLASMRSDMELRFSFDLPKQQRCTREAPHWNASMLASYVCDNPTPELVRVLGDMLDSGIIDVDALEFDPAFQEFVKRRAEQ